MEEPKTDRTTISISKELHREFRVTCAQLAVTQKAVLEYLIENWIRSIEVGRRLGKTEEE